jgi:hypothetical protein
MPAKLTKDEQELFDHINLQMKKNKSRSWFQAYPTVKYQPIVDGLIKKGCIEWSNRDVGYILCKEKTK